MKGKYQWTPELEDNKTTWIIVYLNSCHGQGLQQIEISSRILESHEYHIYVQY